METILKHNNPLWANDLDSSAALVQQRFPKEYEEIIRLADDFCNNTFLFRDRWEMERTNKAVCFDNKIVWNKTPNGDPEWVYAFNRLSFVVVLGKAWRFTGNPKYTQAYVRIVNDWIDNATLNDESKFTSWRTIETGIRSEYLLRSIKLFENSADITTEFKLKLDNSLKQHAKYLTQRHDNWHRRSNWGILQSHGLFLLGVYFNDDKTKQLAISRFSDSLPLQVFHDGVQIEQSPMYHGEVLHCCLNMLLIARQTNVNIPLTLVEQIHKMSTALSLWNRPDGCIICQSDSDEVDARDLLVLSSILFNDGEIKAYAGEQVFPETIWDFGSQAQHIYDEIKATGLRGSVALWDSGNYMLWDKKDKSAGFLHFHCGYFGGPHGHADQLHIDLVANGETILADSGRYTYVSSCELRKALKRPSAHNTVLVDNIDFTEYKDSWYNVRTATPVRGHYRFTKHLDYVNGMHLGYLKQGIVAQRHVIRLGTALWLLWDVFYAQDENATHQYNTFFHFGKEGNAILIEDGAKYQGKCCSAILKTAKKDQTYTMTPAPISTEYNVLEQADCLQVTTKAQGTVGFATAIATGSFKEPVVLQIDEIPVVNAVTNEPFLPSTAQAVKIQNGTKEWTVIICHNEILVSPMLKAGNCLGYGKVIVFEDDSEKGTCLSW